MNFMEEAKVRFEKKGLIYCPKGEHWWEKDSFMTPTALLIENDVICIWGYEMQME